MVPSHGCCYVSHGGHEHKYYHYQVLTNPRNANLTWYSSFAGQIPAGALLGGEQMDGTPLFIGRAYHHGSLVIGKVHPRHNTLYVPFGGEEVSIHSYEILVVQTTGYFWSCLAICSASI